VFKSFSPPFQLAKAGIFSTVGFVKPVGKFALQFVGVPGFEASPGLKKSEQSFPFLLACDWF